MTKQSETHVTSAPAEPKAKLFDLSMPQLVAGALTAVTMAALGSRLGAFGTFAGAAVGSVVAAIVSTLYTVGVHKTTQGVQRLVRRRADGQLVVSTVEAGSASGRTNGSLPLPRAPRRGRGWGTAGAVLAGAAATFALTLALVTGAELTTGKSLNGKDGTTLSQVAAKPSTSPSAKTTPTPSVTPSASATPTVAPSTTPAATPTSSTPSVAPPTATPSTTGIATAPGAGPTSAPDAVSD